MGFHPRRFMGPSCVKTTAISPFHDLVTGLTHWEWQSFWQMFLALIKKWTGTTTAGNDAPDATTREHSRQTYPASIFCFLFSQVLFSSSFIVAFSVLTDSTSKALCNRHIFFYCSRWFCYLRATTPVMKASQRGRMRMELQDLHKTQFLLLRAHPEENGNSNSYEGYCGCASFFVKAHAKQKLPLPPGYNKIGIC